MSSLNHIFKFGTTALAALVLSACGSSGGGSDAPDVSASTNQTKQSQPSTTANNTTQQPSTTANNTTQQPSTTTSTNNQTASSQSTPAENVAKPSTPNTQSGNTHRALTDKHAGFVIPKKGGTIQTASISGNPNLYVLDVEGKSINILPNGMGAGKVLKITANNITRIVNGSLYKNVRWGLITEDGLNNYYLVSYGINPTTDMPTSGSATYVGQGVHGYADSGSAIDTYRLSNAKFNVNFADKSFEGSITPDDGKAFGNINAVKLSAKIDGNQFNGKTAEGTEAVGRFYGNNASELAGSYVNEKASYLGVFGAQKK